jgi:hypothetical protein
MNVLDYVVLAILVLPVAINLLAIPFENARRTSNCKNVRKRL